MEEDQMINPQAQEAQQRQAAQVPSKFHKFTVLLSVGCLCTYANQISLQPSTKRRALFTAKSVDSDTGKSFFFVNIHTKHYILTAQKHLSHDQSIICRINKPSGITHFSMMQFQGGTAENSRTLGGHHYSYGGLTPQNLLGSGQTPHSLLSSPSVASSSVHHPSASMPTKSHVYAPVPSPAGVQIMNLHFFHFYPPPTKIQLTIKTNFLNLLAPARPKTPFL
jgi:hypothetical protein